MGGQGTERVVAPQMYFCTNLFYMEFLHEDMVIKIYEELFMH